MNWDVGALNITKFSFEFFFRWVDQHLGFIVKNQITDFDKGHHITLTHSVGIELDQLILMPKLYSEYGFVVGRHGLK